MKLQPVFRFSLMVYIGLCVTSLDAQMTSVVNSNADDEFAHAFDKTLTPEDEASDGFCADSLGRCTLRAALEEASILGLGAYVTFAGDYSIFIDANNGSFGPPENSRIHGHGGVLLGGQADQDIMVIENNCMIQGLEFHNGLNGITVGGNNNLIGGSNPNDANVFTACYQFGIGLFGQNNVVKGNYIGIDRDNTGLSNLIGIEIFGENSIIGGTTPGERNYISGNDIGIAVYTTGGTTFITGNYIGTDTSSTQAIPNRVGIDCIGPNTTIGGITTQERNVISGNTEEGVLIGIQATDNAILGNHIGLDISGLEVVPNRDGIVLGPGSLNTLVEGNQIVSNTQFGIFINGLPFPGGESQHHKVRGNTIELNGVGGIGIQGNCVRNIIGSSLTQDFPPNMIQFNGLAGVANIELLGTPSENTIRKNSFRDNGIEGIDNCANCQDAIVVPVITSYTDLGLGVATIAGTHPTHSSVIDVYTGEKNTSGIYEGKQWIGSGVVNASGMFLVNADPCDCDTIVATATNPGGSTSQFSPGFPALITAVDDPSSPDNFILAYPNPFVNTTTIQVDIMKAGEVILQVFDVMGHVIQTLCQEHLNQGTHYFPLSLGDAGAGIYFYQLSMDGRLITTGKLISFK